jgi:DNA invertase Pin-like site-specific DNA recombinase
MTSAAIYARVSTAAQADRELPLEGQLDACRTYAERRGYVVAAEYVDAGISGLTDDRPEFQRLLADAATRPWDLVIVWEYSRFSRVLWHSERYIEMLDSHGIAVESVTEGDSSWERVIRGKVAQDEARSIGARTMRGKRLAAQRGLWPVGRPPYGYRKGEDGRLAIIPEEAAVLRLAWQWIQDGLPMVRAAERLTQEGYRTRSGRPWHYGTLRHALLRPATFGCIEMRVNRPDGFDAVGLEAAHEPILDRAQVAAKYTLPGTPDRRWSPRAPYRRGLHPLAGILRCPCGTGMTCKQDRRYGLRYYVCPRRSMPGHRLGPCHLVGYLRAEPLEDRVWRYVWRYVYGAPSIRRRACLLARGATGAQAALLATVDAARSRLADLETRERHLVEAISTSGQNRALLRELSRVQDAQETVERSAHEAQQDLENLRAGTEIPEDLDEVVALVRQTVEAMDGRSQNAFLRSCLDRVELVTATEIRVIVRPGLPPL